MLVYEKKIKEPLNILEGDGTTLTKITQRSFTNLYRTMPSTIYSSILKDNSMFLFEKNVYSIEFFDFFLDVMRRGKDLMDITSTCLDFTIDILAHAYHNKTMIDIIKVLEECFQIYPDSENKILSLFIQDHQESITTNLLVCSDKFTRECFAKLLASALLKSSEKDFGDGCISRLIIDNLLSLIPQELSKHAIKFESYWELLSEVTRSKSIAIYMLSKGCISLFIDFYLGSNSPLLKSDTQRQKIGNNVWTPNFFKLITTLSNLDAYTSTKTEPNLYNPTDNDIKCITDKEFYEKTIKNRYDCKSLSLIIQHWGKNDKEFSDMISEILIKGSNNIDTEEIKEFYEEIGNFLNIKDDIAGNL